MNEPKKFRRAWFAVSSLVMVDRCRKLTEAWAEEDFKAACGRAGPLDSRSLMADQKWCEVVHDALFLPKDCKVVAISPHFRFMNNEWAIMVEAPQFAEVSECSTVQEVRPLFTERGFEKWEFK